VSAPATTTLPPFVSGSDDLHVIIETPKGCRNKYAYDQERQTFVLKTVLPNGAVFPFDFGSVPGTKGQDGDPLDILVLMDEPAFTGCLVEARLIGVIEATQTEKNKKERNDRLIAVAAESHTHGHIRKMSDLNSTLLEEIEHFFISYNESRGKKFKPIGRYGPKRARRLIKTA
jgi:inorganic pyrophosphatase